MIFFPSTRHHLFFIPAFLIFISSIISFGATVSISNNVKNPITFIYLLFAFISGSFILYSFIYTWRSLKMTSFSFLRFFLIILQGSFYIYAIYILSKGLPKPIFVNDLSSFSQYRYLFFSFLALILIIFYFLTRFYKTEINFHDMFHFFSVREEMYTLLYTWNQTIWGTFFSKLIDWLGFSMFNRFCYIIIHFTIFYVIRILNLILFINFTFFHGDLRLILYLLPLSFFIWFLHFFEYYFHFFFTGTINYIKTLIRVQLINKEKAFSFHGTIKTLSDNLSYELTPEAYFKGYTYEDLAYLAKTFSMLGRILTIFDWYFWFIKILSFIIIGSQIVSWYFIAYIFFFDDYIFKTTYPTFLTRIFSTKLFLKRSYASEVFYLKKGSATQIKTLTEGTCDGKHAVVIDKQERNPDNPKEVRFKGQITHGTGSSTNPSAPLNSSQDLKGASRAQNFVPAVREPTYIPESLVEQSSIPGSAAYLATPEAKANLAKYRIPEENT